MGLLKPRSESIEMQSRQNLIGGWWVLLFETGLLPEPAVWKEKTVWASSRFQLIRVNRGLTNLDFFPLLLSFFFFPFPHEFRHTCYTHAHIVIFTLITHTPTVHTRFFLLPMPVRLSVVFFHKKVNSCATEKQAICPGLFG